MRIRLATSDDMPVLTKLVGFAAAEMAVHGTERDDAVYVSAIRYGIATGEAVVVAEQDDEIVGYCAWVHMPASPPGKAEGLGTWTFAPYRREHVARDMRRFAEEHAAAIGCRYVDGVVADGNEAGLQSALRAGFRVVGVLVRKDFGDGQEGHEEATPAEAGLLREAQS